MEHTRHADRVHGWIVDNQIGKHWPEFYRRVGKVAAAVANARRVRKEAQGMGDFAQHMSRYTRPSVGPGKNPGCRGGLAAPRERDCSVSALKSALFLFGQISVEFSKEGFAINALSGTQGSKPYGDLGA